MLEHLRAECDRCAQHVLDLERQLKYAKKDLANAEKRLSNYENGMQTGAEVDSLMQGLIAGGMSEEDAREMIKTGIAESFRNNR